MILRSINFLRSLLIKTAPEPGPSEEGPAPSIKSDDLGELKADKEPKIMPFPSFPWGKIRGTVREHWSRIRKYPYLYLIVVLIGIQFILARDWLTGLWQSLLLRLHKLFLVILGQLDILIALTVALLLITFGVRWVGPVLRYFWELILWLWNLFRQNVKRNILIGFFLLIILWLLSSRNTWVILPFTMGSIEGSPPSGEEVATQLIAELNQVGVGNPAPLLAIRSLQNPRTHSGSVISSNTVPISADDCPMILQGPAGFGELGYISLSTLDLGGTQGEKLDLGNLSIGTFTIPSKLFTQFVLRLIPIGYREFSGQVVQNNNGELEIIVIWRNPPKVTLDGQSIPSTTRALQPNVWRVVGPHDGIAEMIEVLALMMALDMNPQLTQSTQLNLSDWNLAFALGNEAFRNHRFNRARVFYEIANRLSPEAEATLRAMLALSHYHSHHSQSEQHQTHLNSAIRILEAEALGESSANLGILLPYLACLYDQVGSTDKMTEVIAQHSELVQGFADSRINELKNLSLLGPGRQIMVEGTNVLFVDELGDLELLVDQERDPLLDLLNNEFPRQVGFLKVDRPYFVTPDGEVHFYYYPYYEEAPKPTRTYLLALGQFDGVQQVSVSESESGRLNIFLLDGQGKLHSCRISVTPSELTDCSLQKNILSTQTSRHVPTPDPVPISGVEGETSDQPLPNITDVPSLQGATSSTRFNPADLTFRQIFPVGDILYLLSTEGNVWSASFPRLSLNARLSRLTETRDVKEIYVTPERVLFVLHQDGTIARFDASKIHSDPLQLVDPGTGATDIFFASGALYVLKSGAELWRITNPDNPHLDTDFTKLELLQIDNQILEIFVIEEQVHAEEQSTVPVIYILLENRELWRAEDRGGIRLESERLYPMELEFSE